MDIKEILARVDHTNLKVDAKEEDIIALCDDAIEYNTASVCIPPSYVKLAHDYIKFKESSVKVCTVIGFPNGYSTTDVKCFEARNAIDNGADEVDMVANIGWIKDSKYSDIIEEIHKVKTTIGDRVLKVIIETCLLTEDEKIKMCIAVSDAGADYIKTSTGFSKSGATFEDVKLMNEYVDENVKVKAAGGISSIEDAEKFINLGADRLGTSRIVKIVKEM